MELKNANFNVCNVVMNNLHPMIIFYSKKIENWVDQTKDFKVYFRVDNR